MIKNYKHEILIALFLIGFSISFYYLYGILLPFIIGLFLAFSCQPMINKIQKKINNKNLATTLFLAGITGVFALCLVFFAQYINRDFKRLNQSFVVLASNNQANIDKVAQKVKLLYRHP